MQINVSTSNQMVKIIATELTEYYISVADNINND